jgi:hypothetical protein
MIEKKKTTTYVDGNPVPGLGLVQTCIRQYIEEWDHHPIFLSINTNFIVFGLSRKRIKFMIYHT